MKFNRYRRLRAQLAAPIRWRREVATLKTMLADARRLAKTARDHSPTARAIYSERVRALALAVRVVDARARQPAKVSIMPKMPDDIRAGMRGKVFNDPLDDLWRPE